ncbi:MAG: AAA family ATPase [Solirubrobacteraceae bacterium]
MTPFDAEALASLRAAEQADLANGVALVAEQNGHRDDAHALGSDGSVFALPLDEFLAAKSDAPSVLIGDEQETLLPAAGLLILFAKGGRGKTTLTIDAAFHLASGRDWLGFKVPAPLRVLILENEGPREPFRQKLAIKHKRWEHEIPGEIFVYVQDWGSLSLIPDTIIRLRRFVVENRIDLVVGDPLDSLGIRGVGSPEDTREFVKMLTAAGLTQNVAFWLLHHPRKADADDELDEVSGAWRGRVDSLLRLDKLDGDRARLSFPKIRWSRRGNRPALILAFDADEESFAMSHEELEDRDYVAEIAELLSDGAWRTCKQIAAPAAKDGIGANADAVKDALESHPERFERRTGDAAKDVMSRLACD